MSDVEEAARRASQRDLPREALSSAIGARLEQLGAPAESLAAARRIASPGSVVVVAGQQPVLLGGPGLVWAKACDALALARGIEDRTGIPAIAVFWNASEDHDHAECDHVRMELGSGPEMLRVALPGDRRMLSRVPVPADARVLHETLRARLPAGPSRDEILAALDPAEDDTMGSWFSRIVLRTLGRHGLVVVEPERLRAFARRVVDEEIDRPGALAADVRNSEAGAVAAGEPAALELVRDELFFLVDDTGRRLRVTHDAGSWRVEDGRALTTAQVRAMPPSAFSWNVAARVLAQDVSLPTAVQVCGPSEIRYCARLRGAHDRLGVASPALVERTSWTFVTTRAERLARELGVDPLMVVGERSAISDPLPAQPEPSRVAELRAVVGRLPGGGSAAVQRRRAALVHGVEAYAEALARDDSERISVDASRRAKLLELLRPQGEPQDRHVSPLPWFAQRGLEALVSGFLSARSLERQSSSGSSQPFVSYVGSGGRQA